jgi:hypothetical protein
MGISDSKKCLIVPFWIIRGLIFWGNGWPGK